MALSWSELSSDQKVVYLLEGLAKSQVDNEPIACRVCDQILFGSQSLVKHFSSHFIAQGTVKPRLNLINFVSSENNQNLFSNSPPFGRSLSVAAGVGEYSANGFSEPSAMQIVSRNLPNRSLGGNYVVPTMLGNSVLRRPILPCRPQPYPSPSIPRSTSRGASSSLPKQSSKYHSGFCPRLALPQNVHSPVCPIASGMYTSPIFQLAASTVASDSLPVKQSNFHSSVNADGSTSQSVPGTNAHALGAAVRSLIETATRDAVYGCSSGYTKPYISKLELPMKKVVVDHNDEGDDNSTGGMDLNLKL